jgi:hypothetical protein
VLSENTIDDAGLMPSVYQTFDKWWRHNAIEFSDTTGLEVEADTKSRATNLCVPHEVLGADRTAIIDVQNVVSK